MEPSWRSTSTTRNCTIGCLPKLLKRTTCSSKSGKSTSSRERTTPSSGTPPPSSKKPKTSTAEDVGVKVPSAAELEVCGRIARVGMDLYKRLQQQELNPAVSWLEGRLDKIEAKNLWAEADLLDQNDKLKYCRDELILKLIEENHILLGPLDFLASADEQIVGLEVQLVANQDMADQAEAYERQLAELQAEMAEVQAQVEACRAELERVKNENDAAAARVADFAGLGFDRCKDLVAVTNPDHPLELLEPEHEIYKGKLVKPKLDVPLEEGEVIFEHSGWAKETEEATESDSLEESETLSNS